MRKGSSPKRPVLTDPLYKSKSVTRMVNIIMRSGRKQTARDIVYTALEKLSADQKEATTMFEQAIKNAMPSQEVRSRRVGGATYQVPMPVKHDRSEALAIRWIVTAARNKQGKEMSQFLYQELMDAFNQTGDAIRKRDEVHRMADANKAFSHFARF